MSNEDEIAMWDVTHAGAVISDCISRDVGTRVDLEESLEASRYTSHPYTTHPKEWPPCVEVVDTSELPGVLIKRYNAAGSEGTALCGIFPEIRRAWASVDNSLFMWCFDKWWVIHVIFQGWTMSGVQCGGTSYLCCWTSQMQTGCFC